MSVQQTEDLLEQLIGLEETLSTVADIYGDEFLKLKDQGIPDNISTSISENLDRLSKEGDALLEAKTNADFFDKLHKSSVTLRKDYSTS